MTRSRVAAAACACICLIAACSGVARASVDMETGIADDAQILYSKPGVAARTVAQWQRAGVDVVRLHARWAFIAPDVGATRKPRHFHAADPNDPHYNWGALDRAISLLTAAHIMPMVSITGSGPLWGTRHPARHEALYDPDPRAFGAFAHAVAARYAGVVHRYIIWNEPNQAGWLQPQFSCSRGHCTPRSPAIYRNLFRAASHQIRAVDPGAEILIGALAPRGSTPARANAAMRPLRFLRALGCVNSRYERIRGGGCAHAQKLRAFGFAYHPDPVQMAPTQHAANPDDASIGDLRRLEHALDRTTAHGTLAPTYGRRFNLYLTEFGYQTNPPDRAEGVTPTQQAAWIQQSDFIGYSDPRVRNMTAYLWRDEPQVRGGSSRYTGWQSGAFFAGGRAKPLAHVFDHPFFVDARRGRRAIFWGQVRPGTSWTVNLQRRSPRHRWATIATLPTNADGYWTYRKWLTSDASYRFQYSVTAADPDQPAQTITSGTQRVARTR